MAMPEFDDWYADQRPRVYVSMLALSGDADLAAEVTDTSPEQALVTGAWVVGVACLPAV